MGHTGKYNWDRLNHLQVGKYAEYLVKMEFTLHGFDIYTSEVDDRGIDFVIRVGGKQYYDVQVKSCREMNYIFFHKDKFEIRENLFGAVVIFINAKTPKLFLFRSTLWLTPNKLLVSHNYKGKQSKPEWGLNISRRNWALLEPHAFQRVVRKLLDRSP